MLFTRLFPSVFVVFEYYVVSITSALFLTITIRFCARSSSATLSLPQKAPSSSSRGVLVVFLPLCCVLLLFYRICFYVTRQRRVVASTSSRSPHHARVVNAATSIEDATTVLVVVVCCARCDDDHKPSREARGGKIERPAMPTRLTKPFHARRCRWIKPGAFGILGRVYRPGDEPMSKPYWKHLKNLNESLKEAYNATSLVIMPGSGTYGMENWPDISAPGKKRWFCNGYFRRWTDIFEQTNIPI